MARCFLPRASIVVPVPHPLLDRSRYAKWPHKPAYSKLTHERVLHRVTAEALETVLVEQARVERTHEDYVVRNFTKLALGECGRGCGRERDREQPVRLSYELEFHYRNVWSYHREDELVPNVNALMVSLFDLQHALPQDTAGLMDVRSLEDFARAHDPGYRGDALGKLMHHVRLGHTHNRQQVLFTGGVHAREWLALHVTIEVLLRHSLELAVAGVMLTGVGKAQHDAWIAGFEAAMGQPSLLRTTLTGIPLCNPLGYYMTIQPRGSVQLRLQTEPGRDAVFTMNDTRMLRKPSPVSADLNRNFPTRDEFLPNDMMREWARRRTEASARLSNEDMLPYSDAPVAQTYRGEAPMSESESQWINDWLFYLNDPQVRQTAYQTPLAGSVGRDPSAHLLPYFMVYLDFHGFGNTIIYPDRPNDGLLDTRSADQHYDHDLINNFNLSLLVRDVLPTVWSPKLVHKATTDYPAQGCLADYIQLLLFIPALTLELGAAKENEVTPMIVHDDALAEIRAHRASFAAYLARLSEELNKKVLPTVPRLAAARPVSLRA